MSRTRAWCALLDIGSTYTKALAVDLADSVIVSRAQVPTTASGDVRFGMREALSRLGDEVGGQPVEVLASSSARGGLGVIAVGLVPRLTLEAAQLAALGAGAKVLKAYGYSLTESDLLEITAKRPDVVLLCGGIDGGDEDTILGNAHRLAQSPDPSATVIVAGNRTVSPRAVSMLSEAGWNSILVPNVLPDIDTLNPEPARRAIRAVFIDRIIESKGIGAAAEMLDAPIVPTPAAVLTGCELLAGRGSVPGLFPNLLVVDVGGATTDVVSVLDGPPPDKQVVQTGLLPPVVKRTVEGDLGIRHNARTIVERHGFDRVLAGTALDADVAEDLLEVYHANPAVLATEPSALEFDRALLRLAIREAAARHCGTVEEVRVPGARSAFRIRGKDLRTVEHVVGTGGILSHTTDAAAALSAATYDEADPTSLRPLDPELHVDHDYALFACGLLAERRPEVALAIGAQSLRDTAA